MQRLAKLALVLTAALVSPSCATGAQVPGAAVRGVAPVAGYDALAGGEIRRKVRFYRSARPGHDDARTSRGEWFATRVTAPSETVEIADASCPGLSGVLTSLSQIDLGRFDLPGITEPNLSLDPARDGETYRLWGRLGAPSINTSIEVRATSGPIGEFGRSADQGLSGCWAPYRE